MKKSKKNYAIIVLIVILLALAVGYAAFTASLTINGTVTGTADWDVRFQGDGTVTGLSGNTSHDYGTATVSTTTKTNDTMTVAVDLGYPGDACEVKVVIENAGELDAKLTGFTLSNKSGFDADSDETDDVIVTLPTIPDNELLEAGDTCEVTFGVQWAAASEATDLGEATFDITFTYEQNDGPVTPAPTHDGH